MFRNHRRFTLVSSVLAFAACTAGQENIPDGGVPGPGQDAATPGPDGGAPRPDGALAESQKNNVRIKNVGQLAADFAAALSLSAGDICREVGRYDCFAVHKIPLGGVEPYVLGINNPVDQTTVTTPFAVDRIALSGCRARVDADLADPASAVIFRELGVGSDGTLADPGAPAVRAAIGALYQRFVQRDPTESEMTNLIALYAEATAASEPQPARAWAITSCYAVATTVETLFY